MSDTSETVPAETERRIQALEAHAFRTASDLAEIRRDMVTKADLAEGLAGLSGQIAQTNESLASAVNLMMGEIGKIAARQEEMAGHVARLVDKSERGDA